MKKLNTLTGVLLCIFLASCGFHNDNTSITLSNSDEYYSMKAHYSKSKTEAVEAYIERKLGRANQTSFTGSNIDGKVTLDDHTVFYMKKSPGVLNIKLDKTENSEEAFTRVKSLCEGIKSVLSQPS